MMMFTPVLLSLASALAVPGEVKAEVEAPAIYMQGNPYRVKVVYSADGAAELDSWRAGPAAFEVDGKPLGARTGDAKISLLPGMRLTLELDLASVLQAQKSFTLGVVGGQPTQVTMLQAAPKDTNYLDLSPADLAKYQVVLQTDMGDMTVSFFPEEAPNHVRNFLDLCATGFYDGVGFHRVSPTFMIQGGDPNTKGDNRASWGTGSGPRQLNAEFNKIDHKRGILSMARSQSPNSASCQFFIITKDAPFLNNQYSVFGNLVSGFDALDKIANAKGKAGQDGTVKPDELPRIRKATVVLAQ